MLFDQSIHNALKANNRSDTIRGEASTFNSYHVFEQIYSNVPHLSRHHKNGKYI